MQLLLNIGFGLRLAQLIALATVSVQQKYETTFSETPNTCCEALVGQWSNKTYLVITLCNLIGQ